MSFAEVADYSLVQTKRKEPLPPGFSVVSDLGSAQTLSFKRARIGLRVFGVFAAILFAVPIPWATWRMLAGHDDSNPIPVAIGLLFVVLEIWILLCLRNEWKLHMIFQFHPGHCSFIVQPTFFKPLAREFAFDRDTTFGLAQGHVFLFSPHRPPEAIKLPFPMSNEQMVYLYSRLLDFKYGIGAGTFRAGEPNPDPKPPMQKPISLWMKILDWIWLVLLLALMVIGIARRVYMALNGK